MTFHPKSAFAQAHEQLEREIEKPAEVEPERKESATKESTLKEAALYDLNELVEDLRHTERISSDDMIELISRVEDIRDTLYSTFEE